MIPELVCYYGSMRWLDLLFGYENIVVAGRNSGEV